jgi:ABC-type antimicrobial peptide transport system permease subunit
MALRRNVTRAILTCLGIIIGVGAVIAMMQIGRGSSSAIQKTISTMGAAELSVQPGTAASGGVSFGRRERHDNDAGRRRSHRPRMSRRESRRAGRTLALAGRIRQQELGAVLHLRLDA